MKTIVWVVVGSACWGKSADSMREAFTNAMQHESRTYPTKTFHIREVLVDVPEDITPESRKDFDKGVYDRTYVDDFGALYTPTGAEVRKWDGEMPTKLRKAFTAFDGEWDEFVHDLPIDEAFGGDN